MYVIPNISCCVTSGMIPLRMTLSLVTTMLSDIGKWLMSRYQYKLKDIASQYVVVVFLVVCFSSELPLIRIDITNT